MIQHEAIKHVITINVMPCHALWLHMVQQHHLGMLGVLAKHGQRTGQSTFHLARWFIFGHGNMDPTAALRATLLALNFMGLSGDSPGAQSLP